MNLQWKTCFRIGVSLFVLYLCIYFLPAGIGLLSALLGASAPLLIGGMTAYIVNILMNFYEKHYIFGSKRDFFKKNRRGICMAAAFATLAAVAVLIIGLVVPQLISCVQLILAQLPGVLETWVLELEQWDILPQAIAESVDAIDWQSKTTEILNAVTSGIGSAAAMVVSTVSSVISGVVTGFISIIFAVYLLMGKDRLGRQCRLLMKRYLKAKQYTAAMHFFVTADDCFHKYIVGQCTEAVILGLLCMGGMFLLQLPYAAMIGALTAFTALIPIAGAYIGAFAGAFMILMVSPMKALIFLIFIVVLQQIEGNLIYPRVVGSSLGLPGLWVLAAITIGGGILGIPGMLLGVPMAAVAYRLLSEDVHKSGMAS